MTQHGPNQLTIEETMPECVHDPAYHQGRSQRQVENSHCTGLIALLLATVAALAAVIVTVVIPF